VPSHKYRPAAWPLASKIIVPLTGGEFSCGVSLLHFGRSVWERLNRKQRGVQSPCRDGGYPSRDREGAEGSGKTHHLLTRVAPSPTCSHVHRLFWLRELLEYTSGVLIDTSSLKYHSPVHSAGFLALEGASPIVACPCWRSTSSQLGTNCCSSV